MQTNLSFLKVLKVAIAGKNNYYTKNFQKNSKKKVAIGSIGPIEPIGPKTIFAT